MLREEAEFMKILIVRVVLGDQETLNVSEKIPPPLHQIRWAEGVLLPHQKEIALATLTCSPVSKHINIRPISRVEYLAMISRQT